MKVVAIVSVLLLLIAAMLSTCAYKLYQSFDDFPEQARIENLNQRYTQLITELDTHIERSDSAYSLANALEHINYPPETLYVGMHAEDEENTDKITLPIVDRRISDSGSKLRLIVNGGGYGHINDQYFWILQHPVNQFGYEHIELFFEREKPQSD